MYDLLSRGRLCFLIMLFFVSTSVFANTQTTLEPLLLKIKLNQVEEPSVIECLVDKYNQEVLVPVDDLIRWGLVPPPHAPLVYDGKRYYDLSWYNGLRYKLDSSALKMSIDAAAKLFHSQKLIANKNAINTEVIRPKNQGIFLDYNVNALRDDQENQTTESGVFKAGIFNHFGVGSSDVVVSSDESEQQHHIARLDTTWVMDQPEHVATLRLGDATTSASDWSGATRFGGVQYATNFDTQPNLISFPMPSVSGQSVLPSTVDVFVNNALESNSQVNSGAFSIDNIPVVTGNGTMRVVTRNILGQEQVTIIPYYTSAQLLEPGLSDYSFETGFQRKNYGIDSFDYGDFVTTGTLKHGFTDHLTVTEHGEFLFDQQTAGISANYLLSRLGIVTLGIAGSHESDNRFGELVEAGFSHEDQKISFGFRSLLTSKDFRDIGYTDDESPASFSEQIFSGYDSPWGAFSLSYTLLNNRDAENSKLTTVSYTKNITRDLYVSISTLFDLNDSTNDQIFGSLVWILDKSTSANISATHQDGETDETLRINKSLPVTNGWGYDVETSRRDDTTEFRGSIAKQDGLGTHSFRYQHLDNDNNYELSSTGSVIHFANETRFEPDSQESFAIVRVPGYSNIRVYYRNQLIGKTNKNGELYIPHLLPYQHNDIRLALDDLPMDTSVGSIEKQVVPYYHSGTLVTFNIVKSKMLLMNLVQNNHEAVPSDATVHVITQQQERQFPVGYDGEVYIDRLVNDELVMGVATWDKHSCQFSVKMPNMKEPLYHAGKVVCQ
ncbi:MAG: fimbria/pilus outer membrane usher protein [Gammaproteobacteria bacterium]